MIRTAVAALAAVAVAAVLLVRSARSDAPPARSVAEVMNAAHFAFHGRDGSFTAGGDGFSVRAGPGGFSLRAQGRAHDFGWAELGRGEQLGAFSTTADGTLELDRGLFVERLKSSPAGVEHSWVFREAPAIDTALRLRVALAEAMLETSTDTGLHFNGLRYGHATWVDARGARTPIPARWADGAIELEISAAVLASSAYPAVLDPIIGPELAVDVPVTGGGASNGQSQPVVAYGAGVWLVAWEDARSGNSDVFAARVDATGAVLDPVGIPVSIGPEGEWNPAIGFNGSTFLLAWEDFRNSSTTDLWAARVSPQGVVLDPNGFIVSGCGRTASITSNGSEFYVAFARGLSCGSAPQAIHGARVRPDGGTLSAVMLVSNAPSSLDDPGVAFDGTRYLVSFAERATDGGRYIEAIRVDVDGGRVDLAPLEVAVSPASDRRLPAVAAHPGGWLVAWQDRQTAATQYDVRAARVSSAGVVLDPTGIGVCTEPGDQSQVTITSLGSDSVVAWSDSRTTPASSFAARVDSSGNVLDDGGVQLAGAATAQVASNGSQVLAVWSEGDVLARRFSGALQPIDPAPLLVSMAANEQLGAVAAFNGTQYLLVWADRRSTTSDIYAMRFDAQGVPIDAVGFPVASAPGTQAAPQVASDGTDFLVVWVDAADGGPTDVRGAVVTAAGAVGPELPVSAAPGSQLSPAVAFGGGNYLVVWQDARDGGARAVDVYGTLVSPAGAVLQPGGAIINGALNEQVNPSVGWNGSRFLTSWSDFRSSTAVYASRLHADGGSLVVEDPSGRLVASAPSGLYSAVASDSVNFLVAWEELRGGGYDIFGARVAGDGTVLDTGAAQIPIATSTSTTTHYQRVALAFDGTNYVGVWSVQTGGVFQPVRVNLRGGRVTRAGAVLDPNGGFVVSTASFNHLPARLAAGSAKRLLASYSRFDPDAGVLTQRARVRTLVYNEPPVADGGAVVTPEDVPVTISFHATDFDGDPLTYTVVSGPASGSLTGTGASRTFSPATNFFGNDAVTFQAVDPAGDVSAISRVSLTVTPVNDAPVAMSSAVMTTVDTPVPVTLVATDVDSTTLTYAVVSGPDAGSLSGAPPALTYSPAPGFTGNDAFTFVANDGQLDSAPAVVAIAVIGGSGGGAGGGAGGSAGGGAGGAGGGDAGGAGGAGGGDAGGAGGSAGGGVGGAGGGDAGGAGGSAGGGVGGAGGGDAGGAGGSAGGGVGGAGGGEAGGAGGSAGGGAGGAGGGDAGGAGGSAGGGAGGAGGGDAGGAGGSGGGTAGSAGGAGGAGGGAQMLTGGCGCGTGTDPLLLLGLTALAARRRRSRAASAT